VRSRLVAHARSNVVGYIALFIALGGVAYALEANSVRSKHIKDSQVRTGDVANDTGPHALTSADIANQTLSSNDVGDNALISQDIEEDDLFNDDSLDFEDINEASLSGFDPAAVGPRAWARVETTGDVTEADTKGLTDANVTVAAGGYCFDAGFDVSTIVGSVESNAPLDRFVLTYNQGGPPCGGGDDAMAFVYDVSSAAFTATPIYIEIN
jgi:hypothetical protein